MELMWQGVLVMYGTAGTLWASAEVVLGRLMPAATLATGSQSPMLTYTNQQLRPSAALPPLTGIP